MKHFLPTLALVLCALFPFQSFSQTNISGIVNSYFHVTHVVSAKNCVRVGNPGGLSAGDKVMIIQMKGATVNQSNSSSFGSITNLNNAGNYEINFVCTVKEDSVFFANTLLRTYDEGGKVQLVKIPQYGSAVVNALLQPAPWDSLAGTGGVLAIDVATTLTLGANISADGMGFKGGKFLLSSNNCVDNVATGYVYDPTNFNIFFPQMGAYKGESIANILTSGSGGRGAFANGGGGGNNHNTGGGGGANLASGGLGGNNTTSNGCSSDYPGLGGYALNAGNTKLFLGGGGGAGHGNNTPQTGGGNGGGIILISANTFISAGHTISANGQQGSNTIGDGASGGGAGGSVILNVTNYADQLNAATNGGKGGQVDNEGYTDRCFGDGGGGSGGVIYFKASIPAGTSVAGGGRGGKINSPGCANSGTSAAGKDGVTIPNYTIPQSLTASPACAEEAALPITLIYFKANWNGKQTNLEWKIADAEDANRFVVQRKDNGKSWMDLETVPAQKQTILYQTTDNNTGEGSYQYRLKMIEHDGTVTYSPIRLIEVKSIQQTLQIYPNPATGRITILNGSRPGSLLKIYTATGQLIFQKNVTGATNGTIQQDISFLKKGVYIVKVNETAGKLMVK